MLQLPESEVAGESQNSTPSMLQLPEAEELHSHHQPEGSAFQGAAPVSNPPQATAGQYVTPTPQGEVPTYTGAQSERVSEAAPTPESATSSQFVTPPESLAPFVQDPAPEPRALFQADPAPPQSGSTPPQFVTPTTEQAHHGEPQFEQHAPPPTEAVSHHLTQPVGGSGGYAGGAESAQGLLSQSQMVPSGEGVTTPPVEGQQQGEAVPTEGTQPYQAQQVSSNTGDHHSLS